MNTKILLNNKYRILLLVLFVLHIFFRFYQLEQRANFGWDQVDNAWASFRIIIEHNIPIVGMIGKLNSGIYIGPLYYYLAAFFYFFTRLDPIASPLLSGFASLVSFFVIFLVSKRIFNEKVALVATFIHTFSLFIIEADRVQWPVNFIAPISFLVFYSIHKIINGENKYIIHLGLFTGLAFHIHLTAIFYPIIILFCIPLFPRKISTLKYAFFSLLILLLLLLPQLFYYLRPIINYGNGILKYSSSNYHGLHLTRILQLSHDAFIEFESILSIRILRNSVFFYYPLFLFLYSRVNSLKKTLSMGYLIGLWIAIPWIIFSMYSGEISNYYFSLQRFIVIFIYAYILVWFWNSNKLLLRVIIFLMLSYIAINNFNSFIQTRMGNLINNKLYVQNVMKEGKIIKFYEGNPQSYLYQIYKISGR